jgi:hypothetical protein
MPAIISVFDTVEPLSLEGIYFATRWFLAFWLFQLIGAKFVPGFSFTSTVKKYSLTGLQMFFITQLVYLYGIKRRYYHYFSNEFF